MREGHLTWKLRLFLEKTVSFSMEKVETSSTTSTPSIGPASHGWRSYPFLKFESEGLELSLYRFMADFQADVRFDEKSWTSL